MRGKAAACALLCAGAGMLRADFRYEQTSKITGGVMAGAMKVVGVFSKAAREPVRNTIMVKGDRMATLGADQGQIIDLGAGTITSVNFKERTYSVITFAQMAEALRKAEQELQSKEKGGEMSFRVSVKETGQTREIAGYNTREIVLTLEAEGKDTESGKKGSMVITSDMWMAPRVAGYEEVQSFHKRMAEKIAWTPGGGALAQGRSDFAKAMASVQAEGAKLDGIPVLQVMRMSGAAEGEAGPAAPQPQAQRQQPEQEKPSVGGILGGRLGGRLGGLGGLGRRKKAEPQAEEQQQPPAEAAPQQQAAPAGAGVLMEVTSEASGFSSAALDASQFSVPPGFRQVEDPVVKGMRR